VRTLFVSTFALQLQNVDTMLRLVGLSKALYGPDDGKCVFASSAALTLYTTVAKQCRFPHILSSPTMTEHWVGAFLRNFSVKHPERV